MRDNSANGDHDILIGRCREGRKAMYGRDSIDGSTISTRTFHREDDGRFGRDPDGRTGEPVILSPIAGSASRRNAMEE
jgi:hypothetical protein